MRTFETLSPAMYFVLFMIIMLPVSAAAQTEPTPADSAAVIEMKQLQRDLLDRIRELREQLNTARSAAEGPEREQRIDDIERRVSEIESRVDSLDAEISVKGGESEGWGDWGDGWGDESTAGDPEEDGEWSWWNRKDDDENQFDFSENFFQKFPGNFPWMFPLSSRLHETFFRYNRVEGVYIGLAQPKRLYWHSKPWLVSTGSIGYGFANHTWRYSLGLYLPLYFENQIIEIGGEGHSFTDSKDEWRFDRDENSMTSLIAREDFLDYFERRGFTASASWYYKGEESLNLRASLGYVHDTYGSMSRATNWSIFGGDKTFRINPVVNDGNVNSIVVSGGLHTLPSLTDRSRGWDAQFLFEKAGGTAKGDFEFNQFTVDLRRYQPLSQHLTLNARVRMGMSDGIVPVQRQFELGGPGTLPGYRYKEFNGSHMALFNTELIIRSSIAGNARGWAKNVLKNTNIILFFDAGATNDITPLVTRDITNGAFDASMSEDMSFESWKSDVGIALGSADGDFRIGAAWRLDRSESPNLVIRFSRPF